MRCQTFTEILVVLTRKQDGDRKRNTGLGPSGLEEEKRVPLMHVRHSWKPCQLDLTHYKAIFISFAFIS